MRFLPITCILLFLVFNSCTDSEQEKKLQEREFNLSNKEKEFAIKEKDYQKLIVMRDSLRNSSDSAITNNLPDYILGKWNGKTICIESNCNDHVIGDVRNDVWEFSEKGKTVSAKVTNRTGNVKIYNGNYLDSELKLYSKLDSTSTKTTEINIALDTLQKNRMKGNRKIIGENNCVAKFSLDLEKTKN
ncbi:hypothetical protein [Kaistella sp.]|uniref:hypothetical protein n=1 Tax=Kaistella sp. TaxID=2782235 RepID=UPI003C44F42C